MATGLTPNYDLSYPVSTDPVNVASDIEDLAKDLDSFLTTPIFINDLRVDGGDITTTAITGSVFNTNATTLNIGSAATVLNIGNTSGQTNFAGDVNVATGKQYEINNVSVLTANTLGSGVVNSSLTSVGTISSGTWEGTVIAVSKGGTGVTSSTGTGSVVLSDSPALTGTPTAPTQLLTDNSTNIATTAFVVGAIAEGGGSGTIIYQPTAPTEDLQSGALWVDSDGEAEMLNANDYYNKDQIDQLLSGAGLNAFLLMGA